jgi:hypothetical protein
MCLLAGVVLFGLAGQSVFAAGPQAPSAVQAAATADDPRRPQPIDPDYRLIALPTTLRLPEHRSNFELLHRFNGNLRGRSFSENVSSLFGMDDGASMGLEFRYAVTGRVEAAFYRTNIDRTIQLYSKVDVLYQRRHGPAFSTSLVLSVEGTNNFHQQKAPTIGIVVSRFVGDRLSVYGVPMWVHNSDATTGVTRDTGVVGVGGRIRLRRGLFLVAEVSPRVAGFRPGTSEFGFGIEKRVGGHVFQLNFTNVPATTFGQIARGGAPGALHLGFNLSRKFF